MEEQESTLSERLTCIAVVLAIYSIPICLVADLFINGPRRSNRIPPSYKTIYPEQQLPEKPE